MGTESKVNVVMSGGAFGTRVFDTDGKDISQMVQSIRWRVAVAGIAKASIIAPIASMHAKGLSATLSDTGEVVSVEIESDGTAAGTFVKNLDTGDDNPLPS